MALYGEEDVDEVSWTPVDEHFQTLAGRRVKQIPTSITGLTTEEEMDKIGRDLAGILEIEVLSATNFNDLVEHCRASMTRIRTRLFSHDMDEIQYWNTFLRYLRELGNSSPDKDFAIAVVVAVVVATELDRIPSEVFDQLIWAISYCPKHLKSGSASTTVKLGVWRAYDLAVSKALYALLTYSSSKLSPVLIRTLFGAVPPYPLEHIEAGVLEWLSDTALRNEPSLAGCLKPGIELIVSRLKNKILALKSTQDQLVEIKRSLTYLPLLRLQVEATIEGFEVATDTLSEKVERLEGAPVDSALLLADSVFRHHKPKSRQAASFSPPRTRPPRPVSAVQAASEGLSSVYEVPCSLVKGRKRSSSAPASPAAKRPSYATEAPEEELHSLVPTQATTPVPENLPSEESEPKAELNPAASEFRPSGQPTYDTSARPSVPPPQYRGGYKGRNFDPNYRGRARVNRYANSGVGYEWGSGGWRGYDTATPEQYFKWY